jgi:hypothetical protein
MGFRKTGTIQVTQTTSERYCDICKNTIAENDLPRVELVFAWSNLPYEGFDAGCYDICSPQCMQDFVERWIDKPVKQDLPTL